MNKIKIAILIIFFFFGATFADSVPNSIEASKQYFKKAENNILTKDYKNALINAELSVKYYPQSYEANILLALAQIHNGLFDNALKTLSDLAKSYPDKPLIFKLQGDIKTKKQEYVSALDFYNKALKIPTISNRQKEIINSAIQETIMLQKKNTPSLEEKTEFYINLDKNKWRLAHYAKQKSNSITEYGLIGEDVVNYSWTKLITVNVFEDAPSENTVKCKEYFKNLLLSHAKELDSELVFEDIQTSNDDIYFKWTIKNRGECEVCRIFAQNNNIYFVHYAQKTDTFTKNELNNAIKILKSTKGL